MKKTKKIIFSILAGACLIVMGTTAANAQYNDPKAAELLEVVWQHYERSIRDINDYVVVTEQFTTHYVKKYDNGRPYFVSQVETESVWGAVSALGMHTTSPMADSDFFTREVFEILKQYATYEGTHKHDGLNMHVLFLKDMRAFMDVIDDVDDSFGQLRLYFDDEHWLLRQMEFSAEAEIEEGKSQLIAPVIGFTDYRNISGMMVPFQTRITVGGLMSQLSDDEREEARQALAELDKELATMPAQQRQMMEQMMSGQLDQLRSMVQDDTIEFVINVQEVRVNTGGE